MKKGLWYWLIVCIVIISIWSIGRLTGILVFYNIPTPSCEPNLKLNSSIFVSNLKTARHGDLIVYNSDAADSASVGLNTPIRKSDYIHRLSGMETDTIMMKDGVFYVNGKNTDSSLNLYRYYEIPNSQLDALSITGKDHETGNIMPLTDSLTLVNLTTEKLAGLSPSLRIKKYFMPLSLTQGVFKWHSKASEWSVDNFGPLIIPKDHVFVLGDNRHNTLDSRYTGFIRVKDIKGVKL